MNSFQEKVVNSIPRQVPQFNSPPQSDIIPPSITPKVRRSVTVPQVAPPPSSVASVVEDAGVGEGGFLSENVVVRADVEVPVSGVVSVEASSVVPLVEAYGESGRVLPSFQGVPVSASVVAQSFQADSYVVNYRFVPQEGWQRWVYKVFKGVKPGSGELERNHQRDLIKSIVSRRNVVSFFSVTGGSGVTVETMIAGSIFGKVREEPVVAVDSTHLGDLLERAGSKNSGGVDFPRHVGGLLGEEKVFEQDRVKRYAFSSSFSNLNVVISDPSLTKLSRLSSRDLTQAVNVLLKHYSVVFIDAGSDILAPAMLADQECVSGGVLGLSQVFVVSCDVEWSSFVKVNRVISWMERNSLHHLLKNMIFVFNHTTDMDPNFDVSRSMEDVSKRVRAVVEIPFDKHIREGIVINPDLLKKSTYNCFLELSAHIAGALN